MRATVKKIVFRALKNIIVGFILLGVSKVDIGINCW
jgi:hypothetical protein